MSCPPSMPPPPLMRFERDGFAGYYVPKVPPIPARPRKPSAARITAMNVAIALYEMGLLPERLVATWADRTADAIARHVDWNPPSPARGVGRLPRPTR